jgi:hypothetical protein
VVVADVVFHQAFRMLLVDDDHMVQQVPPATPDPALGNTILSRTSETSPLGLNAEVLDRSDNLYAKVGGSIEDQVAGSRIVGKCLAQLLNHPIGARTPGGIEVQNSSPIMGDDEEAVENAESKCWHGKEIHCGYRFAVVVQKRQPTLGRLMIPRCFSHPSQHGSL